MPPFPELTAREREILDLIASGCNNGAIARRLVLSLKTVRNDISNIFAKLQVTDRGQGTVRARDAGQGRAPARAARPDRTRREGGPPVARHGTAPRVGSATFRRRHLDERARDPLDLAPTGWFASAAFEPQWHRHARYVPTAEDRVPSREPISAPAGLD